MMKAIVQERYGSVDDLRFADVERPIPAENEVLVRVRATSVHADVWHVVSGLPYLLRLMGAGLKKPKNPIPGTEVAGIVAAVGTKVTRFRPGDAVFGETISGIQWANGGAYAEYVAAPEEALARKPENVSFEAAAAIPTSALIALQNLRDFGCMKAGMRVLVNGAGGGVGTLAVQIAKAFETTVTAVDRPEKLKMLKDLGADEVMDFAEDDFTTGSSRYELILDIPGNHPFSACRRALTPDGVYVLVGHDNYGRGMARVLGLVPRFFGLLVRAFFTKQLPRPSLKMPDKRAAMEYFAELLANGKLTPHIDRTFRLAEVPSALRYLMSGQAQGKVVIVVAES